MANEMCIHTARYSVMKGKDTCYNADEAYGKWKKPSPEVTLYDSVYIKYPEEAKS